MSWVQLQSWFAENPSVIVGAVVSGVVLVLFWGWNHWRSRRLGRRLSSELKSSSPDLLLEKRALNWEPPTQSFVDRRTSQRREGPPVRVTLASPSFKTSMAEGYVLDRSTGGLRIAMPTAMSPGSTLQVRAAHAPETVGFVTLIVRSCKQNGDFYEVGCEFEKTPPWSVLLLFG